MPPEFLPWRLFTVQKKPSNEKQDGRGNLFEMGSSGNDPKLYSITGGEDLLIFTTKIAVM